MISHEYQLFEHGYLKLIEHWGSDERIIEAARMSTDKGFLGWDPRECDCVTTSHADGHISPEWDVDCKLCDGTGQLKGDQKLLEYLYIRNHATPFEMGGMIIEVQAPIAVFREWHRHRTQSYNEMSGRYIELPNLNYVPTLGRLMRNAGKKNRQAGKKKGAREITPEFAGEYASRLHAMYQAQEDFYHWAMDGGVPRELARMHIGVGRFSRMRASVNLRNWIAFLTLREDSAAQFEIRQYAKTVSDIIGDLFPRTHGLYIAQRERSELRRVALTKMRSELARLYDHDGSIVTRANVIEVVDRYLEAA